MQIVIQTEEVKANVQTSQKSFEPGDVVKIKSGGPPMTVSREMTGGLLVCYWMADNKLLSSAFPATALRSCCPGA